MPAQARVLLERSSMLRAAVPDCLGLPPSTKVRWLIPLIPAPRRPLPGVHHHPGAAGQRPCRKIAESGAPVRARATRPSWLETALFPAGG